MTKTEALKKLHKLHFSYVYVEGNEITMYQSLIDSGNDRAITFTVVTVIDFKKEKVLSRKIQMTRRRTVALDEWATLGINKMDFDDEEEFFLYDVLDTLQQDEVTLNADFPTK